MSRTPSTQTRLSSRAARSSRVEQRCRHSTLAHDLAMNLADDAELNVHLRALDIAPQAEAPVTLALRLNHADDTACSEPELRVRSLTHLAATAVYTSRSAYTQADVPRDVAYRVHAVIADHTVLGTTSGDVLLVDTATGTCVARIPHVHTALPAPTLGVIGYRGAPAPAAAPPPSWHAVTALLPLHQYLVASGSNDGSVALVDVVAHRVVQTMTPGHSSRVSALAQLADGRLVSASCSRDLVVWSLDAEASAVRLGDLPGFANALVPLPNDQLAVGTSRGQCLILSCPDVCRSDGSLQAPVHLTSLIVPSEPGAVTPSAASGAAIDAMLFLAPRRATAPPRLLIAQRDGAVRCWDLRARVILATLALDMSPLYRVPRQLTCTPLRLALLTPSAAVVTAPDGIRLWPLSLPPSAAALTPLQPLDPAMPSGLCVLSRHRRLVSVSGVETEPVLRIWRYNERMRRFLVAEKLSCGLGPDDRISCVASLVSESHHDDTGTR